ncbi:uncharacterized protein LOC122393199 [Amphibalanus amphitrite]|uniref:uncharacterized protein LOC122393199 n=1 Tax=Amphibalanus amphitrite TaxID=1232801 RepID=UPI001C903AFE|nr:uncharacterized protein LOC122393199 [Amphibalanus amphitrite]
MAQPDECGEIFRASQHTLVIPVGRLAAVRGRARAAEDTDSASQRDRVTQTSTMSRYTSTRGERRAGRDGAATLPRAAGRAGIQIICRYDSVPESDEPPAASCLRPAAAAPAVDIGDFSSIVEIDGDCVIIHSRQEEAAATAESEAAATEMPGDAEAREEDVTSSEDEDAASEDEHITSEDEEADHEDDDIAPVALGTPISERCRRFYESRLRSRAAAPSSLDLPSDGEDTDWGPGSVDSGRESGPDSVGVGGRRVDTKPPQKPASSLARKMALLRREMWSLMHQDDALFRQLLALNDSIEALKRADTMSLSSASSLSSLPELADEETCSPSSTLSSTSSGRQSHLSANSGNYMLLKTKYRSQPQLTAELVAGDGASRLTASRSFSEMSPPSLRQTSPLSLRQLDKLRPPSGHRKQASYDSGIADQEPRGNT